MAKELLAGKKITNIRLLLVKTRFQKKIYPPLQSHIKSY